MIWNAWDQLGNAIQSVKFPNPVKLLIEISLKLLIEISVKLLIEISGW